MSSKEATHYWYTRAHRALKQRWSDPQQMLREYQHVCALDDAIEHTAGVAKSRAASGRNRYCNVLPYDFNRCAMVWQRGGSKWAGQFADAVHAGTAAAVRSSRSRLPCVWWHEGHQQQPASGEGWGFWAAFADVAAAAAGAVLADDETWKGALSLLLWHMLRRLQSFFATVLHCCCCCCRVVLGDEQYINASLIRVQLPMLPRPCAYIATQGPLPTTAGDFWGMVYQLRVPAIVMLTNVNECGA
jgi:protein tyrosine phosphatase